MRIRLFRLIGVIRISGYDNNFLGAVAREITTPIDVADMRALGCCFPSNDR